MEDNQRKSVSPSILLIAVNARYSHCAFAARSLKANLRELEGECEIFETDTSLSALQLAEHVIASNPVVAGFSIYLWNVRLVESAVRILRKVAPRIRVVAGGPELTPAYPGAALFDRCIIGEGETAFREYCEMVLSPNATSTEAAAEPSAGSSVVIAPPVNTDDLKLPLHLYTDEDIANRVIYIEASRGCPCACRYCTSAATGLRLIPLAKLLPGISALWSRGARRFKFLDRSFTAAGGHAHAVMAFFLERSEPGMQIHFEINTGRLTPDSAQRIASFPQGALHLECGVQTLNPTVAGMIGRSQEIDTTLKNLRFLVNDSGAAVHADLIFGLPGETQASFAGGFNKLIAACDPPVVQINLLKGLPGTELAENADGCGLVFSSEPPYELLQSSWLSFTELTHMRRMARCWELVHNRGQMTQEARALHRLSPDIYGTYARLADHIHAAEGRLHRIARPRLQALAGEFLHQHSRN